MNSYIEELKYKMSQCFHNFYGNPNPYHMENDVLTHTNLVIDECYKNKFLENYDKFQDLLIAAFFHDTGKINTRKEKLEKSRVSFYNHEFASLQYLIDYLVYSGYKTNNFESIILAINNHFKYHKETNHFKISALCNFNIENYEMLFNLCNADSDGRITNIPYSKKEYNFIHKPHEKYKIENCQIIFFGGVPGCGKDYLAESETFGKFDLKISWDDIRIEEYKKQHSLGWKNLSQKDLYRKAWEFCNKKKINLNIILKEKVNEYILKGKRVAICNTFCTKRNRNIVKNLFPKIDIGSIHVFCDLKTMIERDKNRNSHYVGEDVIKKFAYNQELPTMNEQFKCCKYVINGDKNGRNA